MRALRGFSLSLIGLVLAAGFLHAQRAREPLNDQEIDQLRDAALEPEARLKLYIKFIQARLLAIEQLRSDPKIAADRGQRIHDLLQDVTTLADELTDNIDTYSGRADVDQKKMAKPLGAVIEATSDWQLRLRALKQAGDKDPKAAAEAHDYYFVLDTTIDAVNDLADDARQTLAEEQSHSKKH